MANEWRVFKARYVDLIEEVHDRNPGFWTELWDLAQVQEQRSRFTRRAMVREFPATREQGSQTTDGRTLGQHIFEVMWPEQQERAAQTQRTDTCTVGVVDCSFVPLVVAYGPIIGEEPIHPIRGRGRGRGLPRASSPQTPGWSERRTASPPRKLASKEATTAVPCLEQ